jgi:hypothetical protein
MEPGWYINAFIRNFVCFWEWRVKSNNLVTFTFYSTCPLWSWHSLAKAHRLDISLKLVYIAYCILFVFFNEMYLSACSVPPFSHPPSALRLNWTYTLLTFVLVFASNLAYRGTCNPSSHISCLLSIVYVIPNMSEFGALCNILCFAGSFYGKVLVPFPTPTADCSIFSIGTATFHI